jgi:hypothetical protein
MTKRRTTTIEKALLLFFPRSMCVGLNLISRRRSSMEATFFFFLFLLQHVASGNLINGL